ncbi:hypothetical protein BH23PAT2_BH23PAT2_08170 [soil metagenome]
MGDIVNEEQSTTIEPGTAGAPEGVTSEPTDEEIKNLYEATGVKASVPTGKLKGRPKSSAVRAKDGKKSGAENSDSGEAGDDDDENKSKNAPASNKDGNSGNKADSKGSKNGADAGELQDESGEADKGVRDSKSKGEGDSERGGKDGSERGTERTGQEEHDEGAASEASDDDEEGVKRPGKSNPEVEKRFQKLTGEIKARDELIEKQSKQLEDSQRKQAQERVAQEDPAYTVEDFRKVRDREGNIIDLDPERAELAWRRWKEGYEQRGTEREARENYAARVQESSEETTRQLMKDSSDAYDSLAGLMDDYPELVSTSGKFDADFAADAMPIINEAIQYLQGTEPGNAEGNPPVIVGLKINPNKILAAMRGISNKKRSLPLNGVNDNVESRSNVNVPHSRSSDPTVHAANDLYKQLGINKRI